MNRIKLLLLIAAFASINWTNKPVNENGPWRFIADKWVSFGVDHDVILFGNAADEFSKLKLRITDGALKMYDMKVYFDNGGVQDVAIRTHIAQGGETRVIDLNGGVRRLSKIEFWYETKGVRNGRARVAVWGRK